jgi:hypothetical protein
MIWTTPEASRDDRTITVINTGTSRILSEATPFDTSFARSPGCSAHGCALLSGLGAHSARHLARAGQLSRTAINTWTQPVLMDRAADRVVRDEYR